MLRGAGDSLTWKYKGLRFLGFLVSEFLGFLFVGFLVFGFLVPKIENLLTFPKDILSISSISHFMFLIDTDLISKISKSFFDVSSSFVGARLFEK